MRLVSVTKKIRCGSARPLIEWITSLSFRLTTSTVLLPSAATNNRQPSRSMPKWSMRPLTPGREMVSSKVKLAARTASSIRSKSEQKISFFIGLRTVVGEIVEQGDTVGLGPKANFTGVLEDVVVPFERLLSIESNREVIVVEIDSQRMPFLGTDFHVRSLLFCPPAVDRVINRHAVFKRVGACDVIIVFILAAPNKTRCLIFFA